MIRSGILGIAFLAWPLSQPSFAVGFDPEPPFQTLTPTADFEIGEGAVNSLLRRVLRDDIWLGSGSTLVRVQARGVSVDFEPGTCAVSLRLLVTYDFHSTQKTAFINFTEGNILPNRFFISPGNKVNVQLASITSNYSSLPTYVKDALNARFQQLPIYYQGLFTDLAGITSTPTSTSVQIGSHSTSYYVPGTTFSAAVLDDEIRFTVAPTLEFEDFVIQIHRQRVNPNSVYAGYRPVVVTNFEAQVMKVTIVEVGFNGTSMMIHGTNTPADMQLEAMPTSNPGRRRYNRVVPFIQGVPMEITVVVKRAGRSYEYTKAFLNVY